MTIYIGWSEKPLGDSAPLLRPYACFLSFSPHVPKNMYVYVEIAEPRTWVSGFDVAVRECLEYVNQLLPVREVRYPCSMRHRSSYPYDNAVPPQVTSHESVILEVAYAQDTPQDMLFFVLNHIRFLSPEFYSDGYRFTRRDINVGGSTEITSYRMYLDHTISDSPAMNNHVPVRYSGSFKSAGLTRAQLLEYWFDGPMTWHGPAVQEFSSFFSLTEDDVLDRLEARKQGADK